MHLVTRHVSLKKRIAWNSLIHCLDMQNIRTTKMYGLYKCTRRHRAEQIRRTRRKINTTHTCKIIYTKVVYKIYHCCYHDKLCKYGLVIIIFHLCVQRWSAEEEGMNPTTVCIPRLKFLATFICEICMFIQMSIFRSRYTSALAELSTGGY